MSRIGVFTCWCGENIARTSTWRRWPPPPAHCPASGARCLQVHVLGPGPGADTREDRFRAARRVVVAACSPHMHLKTFRRPAQPPASTLTSWRWRTSASTAPGSTTTAARPRAKAVDMVRMAVRRSASTPPLEPIRVPVTKRALVIGGGVAGIQAALDIADAGPRWSWSSASPRSAAGWPALRDLPHARLLAVHPDAAHGRGRAAPATSSCTPTREVEAVEGYVGNFKVTIRKKARYVDVDKCTGCGDCWNACPIKKNPSEFDFGWVTARRSTCRSRRPCPRGRSSTRRSARIKLTKGKCGLCAKKCQAGAINFDDRTPARRGGRRGRRGHRLPALLDRAPRRARALRLRRVRLRQVPDVIDSLQFERLASASGPTATARSAAQRRQGPQDDRLHQLRRLARPAKGIAYCSKICCMYNAKHAMLYKHKVHDGEAHVFYMDIRAGGKGYDEFVRRAIEQDGARVPPRARVEDHRGRREARRPRRRHARRRAGDDRGRHGRAGHGDAARRRREGARAEAQRRLRRARLPARVAPKLRPVETNAAGVFVCGACQGPKDIPESVAQASAAAAKVLVMFSREGADREPEVALDRRSDLRRLLHLRADMPLRRHRASRGPQRLRGASSSAPRGSIPGSAWAAAPAWRSAPPRAPTWRASPNSRSTRWWRAWHERANAASSRR
jgi:heterodisulfide reductase subunit A2